MKELLKHLDIESDWEKNLEREQQQRLGLVRLLLQKPKWILMQDAFASLDPKAQLAMVTLIHEKLADSAILTITNQPTIQALYQRIISVC